MRNPRPGPTLSTEVSPLPVPSPGLPRGPGPHTRLAGLLQGSWSRGFCSWEMVALLCCPLAQELKAKPAWNWEG